jgi:rare lipoprotein A
MKTLLLPKLSLIALLAALTLCQCRGNRSYPVASYDTPQRGYASVIGERFHGRWTASGQPYYPERYTAASNTLPLGSVARVWNEESHRSVDLLINDRFPHHPGRIINLSAAAAAALGMYHFSMAPVQVSLLAEPAPPPRSTQSRYNASAHQPPAYTYPRYSSSQPRVMQYTPATPAPPGYYVDGTY